VPLRVPHTHEGRVQPGDWVDVVFRVQARAAKLGQPAIPEKTVTVLEHLKVLEVVSPAGPDATPPSRRAPELQTGFTVVTLAVPAEQSDVLGAVDGRGELWLVAAPTVGPAEAPPTATGGPKGATLAELLGIQPPPRPFETQIYRRGKLQTNRFIDGKMVSGQGSGEQAVYLQSGAGDGGPAPGPPPAEEPGRKDMPDPGVTPAPPAKPE
jgi:hypothetical protein